jgi:hypothetical protein
MTLREPADVDELTALPRSNGGSVDAQLQAALGLSPERVEAIHRRLAPRS